jgi:prepilin-type N-terminal cleavage/methylation domain-containing protein/prepilin-type processing-associated H-X9-DG protein
MRRIRRSAFTLIELLVVIAVIALIVTPPTGCYSMPRYRHHGGVNLTFVDGHVKWMRKGSLRWCRQIGLAEPGATCLPSP